MDNFVILLRDDDLKIVGTIDVDEFVCSIGMWSSAANDIEFKMPLRDAQITVNGQKTLIPLGYYVQIKGTRYGGRIMTYEIDYKTKVVTFKGVSFYGMLNNFSFGWGYDHYLRIYSEQDHPGEQKDPDEEQRGICPAIDYASKQAFLNAFVDYDASDIVPLKLEQSIYIVISANTMFGDALEQIMTSTDMKIIAEVLDSEDYNLRIYNKQRSTVTFRMENHPTASIIRNNDLRPTAIINKNMIHYLAADGTYKSEFISNADPTDMAYSGLQQYQLAENSEAGATAMQNELKSLRSTRSKGVLAPELSFSISKIGDSLRDDTMTTRVDCTIISGTSQQWSSRNAAESYFIQIPEYTYGIKIRAGSARVAVAALLTDDLHVQDTDPHYADGFGRTVINTGESIDWVVPNDAKWLCVLKQTGTASNPIDYTPDSIIMDSYIILPRNGNLRIIDRQNVFAELDKADIYDHIRILDDENGIDETMTLMEKEIKIKGGHMNVTYKF